MFDCITLEWLVSCCDLTNIQVSCDRNKLQGLFYPVAHTFHKRPSGRLWQYVLVLSAKGQAGKECPLPGLGLDTQGESERSGRGWGGDIAGALGRDQGSQYVVRWKLLGWESQRKVERWHTVRQMRKILDPPFTSHVTLDEWVKLLRTSVFLSVKWGCLKKIFWLHHIRGCGLLFSSTRD